jgi:hypothetical protein
MKKIFIILISILFATPLSSLSFNIILHLMALPESLQKDYYEYWSFWGSVLTVAIYELPIYIVIGIPITLLIDFILKLTKKKNNTQRLYLYQFFLYSLSAAVVGAILVSVEYINIGIIIPVTIAVHIYFHILYYLRKRTS